MHRLEPREIAVVRETPVNAVSPAHSGNSCIKHQVSAKNRFSGRRAPPLQKLRPRWTTSQPGVAVTPLMNSVVCTTFDGGLNTRLCVTTRMNSVTQNTGSANRSTPSQRATSRDAAASCNSLSAR